MKSQNLDLFLENQSLKNEFKIRGLDLEAVWSPMPDDLALENRQLAHLLDWVDRFQMCHSRKEMEAQGYHYPPIDPRVDPESDWYRFRRWLQGLPLAMKIKERLPANVEVKAPDALSDEEIPIELERLLEELAKIRIDLQYNKGVPLRLVYEYLMEMLEEEDDLLVGKWWSVYGCQCYCPGCFQRPWCELGSRGTWVEDEREGKMCLTERVQKYVSASPMSLEILRSRHDSDDEMPSGDSDQAFS